MVFRPVMSVSSSSFSTPKMRNSTTTRGCQGRALPHAKSKASAMPFAAVRTQSRYVTNHPSNSSLRQSHSFVLLPITVAPSPSHNCSFEPASASLNFDSSVGLVVYFSGPYGYEARGLNCEGKYVGLEEEDFPARHVQTLWLI
jgi:hypothetical protein